MKEIKTETGSHYRYEYRGLKVDPARIIHIYKITNCMQQQIVKKSLCTGKRGEKDLRADIKDIICACERWIQMLDEDQDEENNNV